MTRARDLAAFVSNADGDIKFDTDTLFIDSSENRVGIQTATPAFPLDVSTNSATTNDAVTMLRLSANSTGTAANNFGASINFSGEDASGSLRDLSTINSIYTDATNRSSAITFKTRKNLGSLTERLRIDDSGAVGIGCTPDSTVSLDVQNLSSSSNNVFLRLKNTTNLEDAGIIIDGNNGGQREYKIGVNTIVNSSDLTFSGGTGYRFLVGSTEELRLDDEGLKFNGDTAAANALDDYEEGSWTPTFSFSGGSVGYSYQSGQYTKIGRKVFLTANLILNSASSPSGGVTVVTLPFASGTDSNTTTNEGYVTGVTVSIVRNLTSAAPNMRAYIPANTSFMLLTNNHTGQGHVAFDGSLLGSSTLIYLSATYNAAS